MDLTAMVNRLGAPVRMVPRRVLLERLLEGFPADRIRRNARAVQVVITHDEVRVEFEDGTSVQGDVLIGADGLHSMVRGVLGGRPPEPTGWCSWQGLVDLPNIVDQDTALMIIGEHGNLGMWPAGGSSLQWWFDLPWSFNFVRPKRPIDVIRSHFTGWSDLVDRVLATLTDDDLTDSAHTMPPTLAQGTNQALLDTMVLCKALSDLRSRTNYSNGDLVAALRWYENTRRRKVKAVSWVAALQVSHSESVLRPGAVVPDRFMTWALTMFLRWASHHRISAEISRALRVVTTPEFVDGDEQVGVH
jgi:FAD-dependent urate hydroxylase